MTELVNLLKYLRMAGYLLILALLISCSRVVENNNQMMVDTANLAQLCSLKDTSRCDAEKNCKDSGSEKCTGIGDVRLQGLRDAALSIGARGGLYCKAELINRDLYKKTADLDKSFNFEALLLPHHVLPPVLVEGRDTLNLSGTKMIRLSDRTYKVVSQARFVTATPNWREYLMMQYTKPEQPDLSLLPKNSEEQVAWRMYVQQGWQQGYNQADLIFQQNLARLKRDYKGIILYRRLLAQKLVSAPQVAERSFGVTGGGESMNVNDRTLTITALPSLKPDSKNWEPVLVDK